jgi:hypothetical protein
MADRYKEFSSHDKYYYTNVSKPHQDFKTKYINFILLFKNNNYRANYISDCKNFYYKDKCANEERKKIKKYYKVYKYSDILLIAFVSN